MLNTTKIPSLHFWAYFFFFFFKYFLSYLAGLAFEENSVLVVCNSRKTATFKFGTGLHAQSSHVNLNFDTAVQFPAFIKVCIDKLQNMHLFYLKLELPVCLGILSWDKMSLVSWFWILMFLCFAWLRGAVGLDQKSFKALLLVWFSYRMQWNLPFSYDIKSCWFSCKPGCQA